MKKALSGILAALVLLSLSLIHISFSSCGERAAYHGERSG